MTSLSLGVVVQQLFRQLGLCRGYLRVVQDNGKEHGNYYLGFRV